MFVVPDSIEPVIGWKGLNVREGVLYSPSYTFEWKPGQPAKAFCHSEGKVIRTWQAEPIEVPDSQPFRQGSSYPLSEMAYGSAIDNWVYMVSTRTSPLHVVHSIVTYDQPETPNVRFDYEVAWKLESEISHGVAPAKRCSCGLYMATEPTFSYGPIQVEIYGWGTVIPGTQGFKVQYAYPKRIFVPVEFEKHRKKLKRYGVEILPFDRIPGLSEDIEEEVPPLVIPQKAAKTTSPIIPSWLKKKS